MPANPLSNAEVKNYKSSLLKDEYSLAEHFKNLKALYSSFLLNEKQLYEFEYQIELERTRQDYLDEKQQSKSEADDLRLQFKQLDNRIIAAEQKLIRGLPDDLELMEKLIAEQESIVADQQKLNDADKELTERITTTDIAHGKALEKIEQAKRNRLPALLSRFEAYHQEIDRHERAVKLKVRLAYLIPLLVIPTVLDYLAVKAGLSIASLNNKNYGILGHYIFFISLIIIQLFAGEKLMRYLSKFFSHSYLQSSVRNLENLLRKNMETIAVLKRENNLPTDEFLERG